MNQTQVVSLVVSLVIFCFVIELIRREKLTFKYAVGWLCASGAAVVFSIFEEGLFKISEWMGFELPSNFIFFTLLCFFVLLSLLLTIFLSQQNNRNDAMARKLGLLEYEIDKIKKNIEAE